MSSRAPPATAAKRGGEGEAAATDQLWAKAAELERDFAGYKRRLAERRAQAAAEVAGGHSGEDERRDDGDAAAGGRGRRYEEYVRKRDERLRQEWRARMERKEAEMQALWACLDRSGSSRGRLAGDDDGEVAAAGRARQDHGDLRQKPVKLAEVRVKPPPAPAPVAPRCGPATTKLSRPRTSVPSSPATASPSLRLSTPGPRRRPLHLPTEPPATPRKENKLPPSSTATAAASPGPGTPRPRTMLSRSRSLFKDRGGCSSMAFRESPRPPRVQAPRSSCDSGSNLREPALPLPMHADAIAVMKNSSCSSEKAGVADLKKASAAAPEPFYPRRSGNNNVVELGSSPPLVIPRDEHESSSEIAHQAGDGNADNKSGQEHVEQSSDKFGSVVITGDSDTEPSYVYIKKDSGEQSPRPCQAPAGLGTCPGGEPRSDNNGSDNVDNDTMESTGSNDVSEETPVTDAEEASRRASSESLYSNVQSSFSPRSELDMSASNSPLPSATEQSPESEASPRPRKKPEVEDAEKSIPVQTTPRSSVTVQSPMDAVTGLKRLLSFGKKNSKGSEAASYIFERTPRFTRPGDGCRSGDWPAGESIKARLDSDDVASADDLDNSYVITPHVRSLQSFVPSEQKGPVLHAKSPRVHRSFFSFSSFKSRAN